MISKLTNQELFHFFEQFSIILRSGMSSIEGLAILNDDSQSARGKEILTFLYRDMEESGSLAHAMKSSQIFPQSATAYVRTGEETGCLDEVMSGLASFYQQEIQITEQIQSAVTYPLIMLGMMSAVIVILLVKVLPVFRQVFRQLGLEVTGFAGGLLELGETMSRYSIVLIGILLFFIAFIFFLCFHPRGRRMVSRIVYKMPGIKDILFSMDYSRLCQCISMGLRSGLSPELCMELSSAVISQSQTKEKLALAQKNLSEGADFADVLSASGLFAGMDLRMIGLGIQAGTVDEVMSRLSTRYEEKSLSSISHIVSVLEPTIVIILSLLVGLVLLSVMMPLLGLLSEMMI